MRSNACDANRMKLVKKQKCVFFDRDGIVNKSPGPGRYVTRWRDFQLTPQFPACLRLVRQLGYQAVIVTNQRAVARKMMTLRDLKVMHLRLRRMLKRKYGLSLRDIAFCPHAAGECSCRKPEPGMLLAMAKKHQLDLKASWMIGDSETDIEAGARAGCRTIRVAGKSARTKADARVFSMRGLSRIITRLLSS